MTSNPRNMVKKIMAPEHRHVLLLLYWIPYFIYFLSLERLVPQGGYHTVWCPLDDRIPFLEVFVIPYLLWYAFLVGIHAYLMLQDPPAFRRMMQFFMISFTATMVIYTIYPTCQQLRPEVFPRDNSLSRLMGVLYQIDTNTNVCPSLHVIGSMAVVFGAWDTKRFQTPLWKMMFLLSGVIISVSTVFVKQHSVLDILFGVLLSLAVYAIVYRLIPWLQMRKRASWPTQETI